MATTWANAISTNHAQVLFEPNQFDLLLLLSQ
jgi:hypothetical protein